MTLRILIIFTLLSLASCSNPTDEKISPSFSNESPKQITNNLEQNLTTQLFTVNLNQDNSLITNSGIIIQIPKGSLLSDKNPVELEIKEALNLKDIFLAGLETKSNNEILSSGGMFYLNAKEGYEISIKQKLKVYVPTSNYNKEMQLYDGIKDSNGNINWINPVPLTKSKNFERISLGEKLYKNDCQSCHSIFEEKTGPALFNIQERRSKQWLYDFTRNSAKVIAKGSLHQTGDSDTLNSQKDYYAQCIFNQWNKTAMTAFPNLTDNELNAIYTFIKLESEKHPNLNSKYKVTSCDSCEKYQKAKRGKLQELSKHDQEQNKLFSLVQKIELNKTKLIAKQNKPTIFTNVFTTESTNIRTFASPTITAIPTDFVVPELYNGVYYELDINTFGWKNIDVLVQGQNGVESSVLWVRVEESSKYKLRVQLLIPSFKISVESGRVKDDVFAIKTKDGKINLPQSVPCYIVALSEMDEKLFFNISEFNSKTNQTINIKLEEKTSSEINLALNSLNMDGLKSNLKEKENTKEIKEMEKEIKRIQSEIKSGNAIEEKILEELKLLEKLKPKNCECELEDNFISEKDTATKKSLELNHSIKSEFQ